jgi:hypothetical protein
MAKSREKIQQLGFWDPEVTTPDHDTVCLWAYENADMLFHVSYPDRFNHPWLNEEVHLPNNEESTTALAKKFTCANPRPNPRVFKRTLEFVLHTHTGYQNKLERIVGYADLLIETEVPVVCARYKAAETRGGEDVFDGFEIGWSRSREAPHILVEAKSILPTVGELMRQIQLYRTAFKGKIIVVSPDDRYKDILTEQGVTFVKFNRQG